MSGRRAHTCAPTNSHASNRSSAEDHSPRNPGHIYVVISVCIASCDGRIPPPDPYVTFIAIIWEGRLRSFGIAVSAHPHGTSHPVSEYHLQPTVCIAPLQHRLCKQTPLQSAHSDASDDIIHRETPAHV